MAVEAAKTELALARSAGRLLRERGLTLAVAEGTTGGRIGERLVRYPGASAFFKGGAVTYDYASRTALLGIPQSLLETHGAVSEEAVHAMAASVRERLGADIGLASSGIAGPAGGRSGRPVGLLWLALATGDGTFTLRHELPWASRQRLQERFTALALRMLVEALA
ncbi:MAG: CinA family protein [Dehalococcoidia bacterium]